MMGPSAENDAGLEARYYVRKNNDPAGKHDDCRGTSCSTPDTTTPGSSGTRAKPSRGDS